MISTAIWSPATFLYLWPTRPRAPLGLGPKSFSRSWASVSGRSQGRLDLESTSSSAFRLPFRGGMPHQLWAPSTMVRTSRTFSRLQQYLFVLFCFVFVFVVFYFCLVCVKLFMKNYYYYIYFLFSLFWLV